MRTREIVLGTAVVALCAGSVRAADVGIAAKKLVIVDKLAAAGKAKIVFAAKDAAVAKGAGADVADIALALSIAYQGELGAASGSLTVPAGAGDGGPGWIVNKDTVAKYVNKDAPFGPTGAKVATIKPGVLVKVVGKNLGDEPIDLSAGGSPATDVCVAAVVTNGAEVTRHCTRFGPETASFKEIASGSGRKLVAKDGVADPGCAVCGAGLPTTTSSTTVSSTTSTTTGSVTTTSTSTTTSTVISGLCGNGTLNAGETCDDGNNSDSDGCPANCFIAACPSPSGTRQVTVSFTPPPGIPVAALTLLLDYPEQKVFMPPAGPQTTIGAANFIPLHPVTDVLLRGADLAPAGSTGSGHAVRGLMADSTAVPPGPIFQLVFQNCAGATAPSAGEFGCRVLDASDPSTNPVAGVACGVTIP